MTRPLSWRSEKISASPTVQLDSRAKQMIAAGRNVISFSVGEPDFASAPPAMEAGLQAIRDGFTHYTAGAGDVRLRKAICDAFARDWQLSYEPGQVTVSNGAKQSVFQALAAIAGDGDEVIVLAPYWVSYTEQIKLAGATPVEVACDRDADYHPDPARVAAAVTPHTKAIIINSPNNPSGAVYTEAEMRGLLNVAREHDLYVISDEIYAHLCYGSAHHVSPAAFDDDARGRTVVISGVSKAYAMTGWRIGWTLCADPELARTMNAIQSQVTSGASSVSQMAALGALTGDQSSIGTMRATFDERRHAMCDALGRIPDLGVREPEGAFYVFVDATAYVERCGSTEKIADSILEEAEVALVPGEGFGVPGALRLSYATSMENITEGARRLAAWFAKH